MGTEEGKVEKERCCCPYCDEEMVGVSSSNCQACGITIFYCPQCRKPMPRDKKVCPNCGAEVKG